MIEFYSVRDAAYLQVSEFLKVGTDMKYQPSKFTMTEMLHISKWIPEDWDGYKVIAQQDNSK